MIYKITIAEVNPIVFGHRELTGAFACETRLKAIKEAKEYYAHELDTDISNIKVVKIETQKWICPQCEAGHMIRQDDDGQPLNFCLSCGYRQVIKD